MSDLIDRQAAIDVINRTDVEGASLNDVIVITEACAKAVSRLPSTRKTDDARVDWDTIAYLSDIRAKYDCYDEEKRRYYRACSKAIDALRHMPTAEPKKGEWIPCSERLPEVNGRYLVTRGLNACGSLWNRIYIANYSDLMGLKSERIWWNGNVGKSDFERIDDVIAWMPLPEPYNRDEARGEEE